MADETAFESTAAAPTAPAQPAAPIEVVVVDNPAAHRFEIALDGKVAAYTQYREEEPGVLAFSHTRTLPEFAGHGVATTLVEKTLEQVGAAGHQVLPYCPFVNAYLRKHPDLIQLVPATDRRRFGLPT